MSTKAIRALIDVADGTVSVKAALDEVDAIERAAKALRDADGVVFSDDPKGEKVRALDVLFRIAKEAP